MRKSKIRNNNEILYNKYFNIKRTIMNKDLTNKTYVTQTTI